MPHTRRTSAASEIDSANLWQANLGRLWAASELERAGAGSLVIAEDRVRVDTVTLLIHEPRTGQLGGVHIRTAAITPTRTVHFEVRRPTFFVDERLYVLLVLLDPSGHVHDFCLLIPSKALPGLGYSETLTLDPLTKRFVEYRVASDQMGSMFLKNVFGSYPDAPF